MYAFVTLGTNNLEKSSNFYDEILKILDIIRVDKDETYVGYAKEKSNNLADFYIMKPFDKNIATNGNGTMISFFVKSKKKVDEFHKKALSLGAINEGSPGPRHGKNYYAYLRDLDGNKICAYTTSKI